MASQFVSFLQQYQAIPATDQLLIDAATERRFYKKGEPLFVAGKVCRELFLVCSGILRIMVINEAGNEVTYFFIREGRLCSILNSFNNGTIAKENILAVSNAEVIVLTRAGLNKLFEQLPYLKPLINQITQQALLDKIAVRNEYLGQDAASRYKTFVSQQPDIAREVPLSDIASYLEITPQSLSRIRKNIR
ncbi:CRP-like cAMP-binding protein [Mucilaginibacter oryzae]|uniref:CRP-like cAMP-binding protein n=1 Tax=Mucilaginibacter oryzae TaxID=468058 RepID=A0A316H618_9SPHI|nr:Crp/Fnr family transcriptional regulator [Mucilaginibacter oryzae]PWK75838.1 CRP-like cAMP-binding protein [Mucilaginibacter oryzae]